MRILISFVAVTILGLLVFTFANNRPLNDDRASKLSMATIETNVKSGARLIDVRTAEEYKDGYIEGAVNTPLAGFQSGQLPDAAKDTTLYLYCRSGNRAGQVKSLLEQAGYTDVVNLGGMDDVIKIGGIHIK